MDAKQIIKIKEFVVFAALTAVIIIIFHLFNIQLRNETLLLAALIFGIYLVASGRVQQFKVMGLEVLMTAIKSRPSEESRVVENKVELDIITDVIAKEDENYLKEQKANLIKNLKKRQTQILLIRKIASNRGKYNPEIANEYLTYFTHVVFVDNEGKLWGFGNADEIQEKIDKEIKNNQSTFVDNINRWQLEPPIKTGAYIIKGVSRKKALDKMAQLELTAIPIVTSDNDRKYEGIIDRETIIHAIGKEILVYAEASKERE